jgi:hypothetical protein
MIEIEGMINNHEFTILIDLGASHNYIDPKVVEILIFPKESMRNVGWYNWLQEPRENLLSWLNHV